MLTIEELKALPIGDWVWLVDIESEVGVYARKCELNDVDGEEVREVFSYQGIKLFAFELYDYGKSWLAYKNKEEAEGKSITLPYLLCTSSKFACVIWRDADRKVHKTYTMPIEEAKGVLEEKRRIQWKD